MMQEAGGIRAPRPGARGRLLVLRSLGVGARRVEGEGGRICRG